MLDVAEREFEILMSEKAVADSQFGGFFDLQVKVLYFLGATIAVLGWLYSDKPIPIGTNLERTPIICLVLVLIGCSVLLQGVIMYATSLSYLEYKMTTLNDRFSACLSLSQPPLTPFRSGARRRHYPQ